MPLSTTIPIPPFPLYLLPPIPFLHRRRRSSTLTTSSTSPASTPSSSPPDLPSYLPSHPTPSHLRCAKCLTDLLPTTSIISKGFTGRHGRAYLVSPPPPSTLHPQNSHSTHSTIDPDFRPGDIPNVATLKPVPRQLVTGAHTVSDVSCRVCGTILGWKYVDAEEEAQKYKVGKFILETKRVIKGVGWEAQEDVEEQGGVRAKEADEIEFDSQDEDECEDLFAGVWSPGLAKRRRRGRVGRGE
ncbi:yippee zinc-binding/DNA-binding /Mis18, centromere assembly-domain-containing protein [Dendryphion nanum]|uniref:Yippee zinc-binding/DNA-binding /Mis18, centromere assembly-domain-containing protein n=1 Tax=Dendryphion nanum TaxID=256645 RepID=A0A9P9DGK6_9PLEO|nr:yippee zinc-binding/DNA-binding /Mis18, centromere assembly-domain-containing protein [Dendryphion nanum]